MTKAQKQRQRVCRECACFGDRCRHGDSQRRACRDFICNLRVDTVFDLAQAAPKPLYDGGWMSHDASIAFLVSLGAGPWKEKRRYDIQKTAIDWFLDQSLTDLAELDNEHVTEVYPFKWQNHRLWTTVTTLHLRNASFADECQRWQNEGNRERWSWEPVLHDFFQTTMAKPEGSKVLWMFARDFLGLPAFPIDRWIARRLDAHELPRDPWYMTRACVLAGVSPNRLNRSWFSGTNPNWQAVRNKEGRQ
jgi:hypothetical protein